MILCWLKLWNINSFQGMDNGLYVSLHTLKCAEFAVMSDHIWKCLSLISARAVSLSGAFLIISSTDWSLDTGPSDSLLGLWKSSNWAPGPYLESTTVYHEILPQYKLCTSDVSSALHVVLAWASGPAGLLSFNRGTWWRQQPWTPTLLIYNRGVHQLEYNNRLGSTNWASSPLPPFFWAQHHPHQSCLTANMTHFTLTSTTILSLHTCLKIDIAEYDRLAHDRTTGTQHDTTLPQVTGYMEQTKSLNVSLYYYLL